MLISKFFPLAICPCVTMVTCDIASFLTQISRSQDLMTQALRWRGCGFSLLMNVPCAICATSLTVWWIMISFSVCYILSYVTHSLRQLTLRKIYSFFDSERTSLVHRPLHFRHLHVIQNLHRICTASDEHSRPGNATREGQGHTVLVSDQLYSEWFPW